MGSIIVVIIIRQNTDDSIQYLKLLFACIMTIINQNASLLK